MKRRLTSILARPEPDATAFGLPTAASVDSDIVRRAESRRAGRRSIALIGLATVAAGPACAVAAGAAEPVVTGSGSASSRVRYRWILRRDDC